MNRIVSVLAIALFVVLAGCSGGETPSAVTTELIDGPTGGDVTTSDPGDGPTGGSTEDVTTDSSQGAVTTDESGDAPVDESPDAGDVTFVDRAAALEEAGSYTSVWGMRSTRDNETDEVVYVTKLDDEHERYRFTMSSTTDGVTETAADNFHADGITYARYGDGSDAQYVSSEVAFSNIVPGGQVGFVASSQDLSEFSYAGTETFDGVTVNRYEMSQAATWLSGLGGTDGEVQWTAFSYVVLVDDRGLVRSETWTASGVTGEGDDVAIEYTYELTDVGSTTIADPSWLGNATSSGA